MIGHYYLGPGHHSQECKVFLAEGLTEGKTHLEEGEAESGMKTMKTTPKKLDEMIKDGKMKDGPSLAALSIFNNFLNGNRSI